MEITFNHSQTLVCTWITLYPTDIHVEHTAIHRKKLQYKMTLFIITPLSFQELCTNLEKKFNSSGKQNLETK